MKSAKATPAHLVCPSCGVYGSFELFANDVDARAVGAMLGDLQPEVAALVQRYLRMHAPAKHVNTWRRARKLLEELVPLIKDGEIKRSGRSWPAPAAAWIAAITKMLDATDIELPLKGHGYLLAIIAGDAGRAEAKAEEEREQQRQQNAQRLGSQRSGASLTACIGRGTELDPPNPVEIRNAVAFVMSEATLVRTRFKESLTEEAAVDLLRRRGFSAAVIPPAIEQWRRSTRP